MTSIIISSHTKALVLKHASRLAQQDQNSENIKILGPVEAPISLLRGQYRYRILLKSNSRKNLNKFTKKIEIKESSFFCVVDIKLSKIDWLFLKREGHRRANIFLDNKVEDQWVSP